jgi:hypothetical protein
LKLHAPQYSQLIYYVLLIVTVYKQELEQLRSQLQPPPAINTSIP